MAQFIFARFLLAPVAAAMVVICLVQERLVLAGLFVAFTVAAVLFARVFADDHLRTRREAPRSTAARR